MIRSDYRRVVEDDFPVIDEQEIISARAEFSRNKIDPDFVRERVHRVNKSNFGGPRIVGGGVDEIGDRGPPGGSRRTNSSPPPRRMVRESELRKIEIEMMMGSGGGGSDDDAPGIPGKRRFVSFYPQTKGCVVINHCHHQKLYDN